MKKLILVLGLVFTIAACTDEPNAQRILEANGFTNIEMTGYSFFSCSEKDAQSTGFIATGPTGKQVKGSVCSGIFFKNSTIRFE